MDIALKQGKLVMDVFDLLEAMSPADIQQLAEQVGCLDHIIDAVTEQLIYGYTPHYFYHGGKGCGSLPSTPLDKGRRMIAEHASEVAQDEIARLANALLGCEERLRLANDERARLQGQIMAWEARTDRLRVRVAELEEQLGPSTVEPENTVES